MIMQLSCHSHHPNPAQLPEASGGRRDIGAGIVGTDESMAEEEFVQFLQLWPLGLAIEARKVAPVRGLQHGASRWNDPDRVTSIGSVEFATHDLLVERSVVAHEALGKVCISQERLQGLFQLNPLAHSPFRGYPMYPGDIPRDGEAVGAYDVAALRDVTALPVLREPADLHQPGPVPDGIRRSIHPVRKPCGLGIQEDIVYVTSVSHAMPATE